MFPSGRPYHGHVMDGQRTLALIAEMIHTSLLVHDDVIMYTHAESFMRS